MIAPFYSTLGPGGYVFPRQNDPSRPAVRELLSQWLTRAEQLAQLPKLPGGVTHPYRRKWRSERSHHPIKAVAEAGGWQDLDTMQRCYDLPEDSDILAVTSEHRKRSEKIGLDANRGEANGPTKGQDGPTKQKPGVTEVIAGLTIAPPRLELGLS